jgi:energy-coupling factor transport system substrate-specific component
LFEAQSSIVDIKKIALLGVLVAINAGIRFLENAIPGPAGFSPTFFLIIITGYFYGSRIGFLMGAMTMFVSGLITGGIGPWLPGQMITAGWIGQSSTLLKIGVCKLHLNGKPSETILLAIFGAFWGMLYGWIINLWFWPFFGASVGQTYLQTASFSENLSRYAAYYLATSLIWDITRSIGNVFIILFFAKPVFSIFKRFQKRFSFTFLDTGER